MSSTGRMIPSRNELKNIEHDLLEVISHATRLRQLLATKK